MSEARRVESHLIETSRALLLEPALTEEVKAKCRPLYTAAKLLAAHTSFENLPENLPVPDFKTIVAGSGRAGAKAALNPAVPEWVLKNTLETLNATYVYIQSMNDKAQQEEDLGLANRTVDYDLAKKLQTAHAAVSDVCEQLLDERLVGTPGQQESRQK